ncbi:MAG: ABC transporter substrate-binding protein [Rhodoferax sp.]|uniref:ABC transporter substrate-binding protein n=1 Tax=Rhodoferax sp. TaxID=50421 RepID=UPI003263271B
MKSFVKLALPMVLGAALSAPAWARDLTVVSWGGVFQDAQREVFFQPFTAASKLPLKEDSWDGGVGALRAKVQAGDANNWDVVQVEADELAVGCEEGLFEKIKPGTVGGASRYFPGMLSECGVPANIFSIVAAYDADKFKTAPQSWADFWDVKKFPGKRAMRSGPKMNLEFALMADGVAPDKVYDTLKTPAGVDRAFAKLEQLKPYIVWWTSGNQPMQLLGSGEVAMTTSYNGRIPAANAADKRNFKVVWKGAMLNHDSWVVLRGSKQAADAVKFLEFFGRPEVQSKWPAKLNYGVGVVKAQEMIPAEAAKNLPSAPENLKQALPLSADFWLDSIDKLQPRFATWAAAK